VIGFAVMINKNGFPVSFLVAVFLATLLFAAPPCHAKEAAHGSEKGGEGGSAEGKGGEFVLMEPIIVNLASEKGKRFLKISIQLEPGSPATAQEITNRLPQVKDTLITVLSSKTSEELLTVEGKFALKEQIRARINNIIASGVKNVFFVEFVIQ